MTDTAHIARPYAKAAFEYAREHQSLAAWSVQLAAAAMIVADPQMVALLNNPKVSTEVSLNILKEILEKSSPGVLDEAGFRFFTLLAQSDRLMVLPNIVKLFEVYKAEEEKTIDAVVTSARPLEDTQRNAIIKALEKRFNCKVAVKCVEDPAVLGGFITRIGDFVIDGSVRSQLERLTQKLCA